MSLRQFIINKAIMCLPPTRFYRLKARMFSWCGFNIHRSVRIVSLQTYGNLRLSIGKDTHVGQEAFIAGGDCTIVIGDFCDIGPRVTLVAGSHEVDMIGPRSAGPGYSEDIVIEDGVWIGANSTILGGVRIGKKAVIGGGSVVTKDIPPFVIAAGVPCKPVKEWNPNSQEWKDVRGKHED
jgi:maltose O-acetyltransferase